MKIALIHIRYIFKGGLETRLFNYIDYFLNRGDEVHLFTSKMAPDIVPPKGLHLHLINVKNYPKPFRNFFFDKILKKTIVREEYDFILSLERTTRQYHVIAPSTHKGYLEAQGKFFIDPIDWVQLYLDKKAFKNSKVIYACSSMVKNEIIRFYGINPDKIKVLFPPTNIQKFNTNISKTEAREKLEALPQKKYFLFVSTSHKRKGLDLLLKVFSKLNKEKYHLWVAGSNFETKLPNVTPLGFVKNMELYYRAADFTLHPAVYEPFGQIVVESLACQTPVFVSENVGAKELLNDDIGFVVPDFSEKSWQNAIEKLSEKTFFTQTEAFDMNELSLETHMEKMLNWSAMKNIK
jgi:glycosyltransferase involved in cell wall biosynthesis